MRNQKHILRIWVFFAVCLFAALACGPPDLDPNRYEVRLATYDQILTYEEFLVKLNFTVGSNEIPRPQINNPVSPAEPGENITIEGWGPKADGTEEGSVPKIILYKVAFDGCSPNLSAIGEPIKAVEMTSSSNDWTMEGVTLEAGDIIAAKVEIDHNEGKFGNLVYIGPEFFTPTFTGVPSSTSLYNFNLKGRGAENYCYEIYVNERFSAAVKALELDPKAKQNDFNWQYDGLRLSIGDNLVTIRLQYSESISASQTFTIPILSLAWPVTPKDENKAEENSYYGNVNSFHGQKNDSGGQHYGLDFDGVTGDYVHALAAGTVYFTGKDDCSGKMVIIEHSHWVSYYLHLDTIEESITEGKQVSQGDKIGTMGSPLSSGCGSGDHLHLEAHYLTEGVAKHNELQKNNNPPDEEHFYPPTVDFINLNPLQTEGEPNNYLNLKDENYSLDLGLCANPLDFWEVDWNKVTVNPTYAPQEDFQLSSEVLSDECIKPK